MGELWTIMIGYFFGFALGVGCALAVMYTIWTGGYKRAVEHSLSNQLACAITELSRTDASLEARLIAACKEWSGRFVGSLGADAADLMCASTSLAGATLAEYEWQFETALVNAIAATPVANRCAAAGLNIADFARALHATARGLKQSCKTQEDFLKAMTAAVRMACSR